MDETYPQFEIRGVLHNAPNESNDLIEVVMWYNHNQANVLRLTRKQLFRLNQQITDYLNIPT